MSNLPSVDVAGVADEALVLEDRLDVRAVLDRVVRFRSTVGIGGKSFFSWALGSDPASAAEQIRRA